MERLAYWIVIALCVLLAARSRSGYAARLLFGLTAASCLSYVIALSADDPTVIFGGLGQFIPRTNTSMSAATTACSMFVAGLLLAYREVPVQFRISGIRHLSLSAPHSFLVFAVSVSAVYLIASIGPGVLWSYQGYGHIKDLDSLFAGDPLGRLTSTVFRPLVLSLICLSVYQISVGRRSRFLVALVPVALAYLLGIAEASRVTALYSVVFGLCFFATGKKRRAYAFGAFAIFLSMYSLEARTHVEQGLSQSLEYAASALSSSQIASQFVANLSSGIVTTAASTEAAVGSSYSDAYKLLSFSPLIGALDGFQAVKDAQEQRLLSYIPFNAFGEAWAFGPAFYAGFWMIITAALLCIARASRGAPAFYLVLVGLLLIGLAVASQYPVRNCVRFFYLIIILTFVRSAALHLGASIRVVRGRAR